MKTRCAESPALGMMIGQYGPEIQSLIHAATHMLRAAFNGATETFDPQAHVVGYSYGPGYKGLVATLILSKTGAKIGIPYASSLADAAHLLAGEGKVHRHVVIKNPAELKTPELKALREDALRAWKSRTSQS